LRWEDGAGDAGTWVNADGRRLEQLIDNLLVNELRYVPSGGTVRVAMAPGEPTHRLVVSDDGPGFPADALPHVFDRFYRADAARSTEGSGLGLAIVREIADRHGGRVRAENAPGGGACVIVELPCIP